MTIGNSPHQGQVLDYSENFYQDDLSQWNVVGDVDVVDELGADDIVKLYDSLTGDSSITQLAINDIPCLDNVNIEFITGTSNSEYTTTYELSSYLSLKIEDGYWYAKNSVSSEDEFTKLNKAVRDNILYTLNINFAKRDNKIVADIWVYDPIYPEEQFFLGTLSDLNQDIWQSGDIQLKVMTDTENEEYSVYIDDISATHELDPISLKIENDILWVNNGGAWQILLSQINEKPLQISLFVNSYLEEFYLYVNGHNYGTQYFNGLLPYFDTYEVITSSETDGYRVYIDSFAFINLDSDFDLDGLTNTYENYIGTDMLNSDTDNDGMPDKWEYTYYPDLDPQVYDGDEDFDGDKIDNVDEFYAGTNPAKADSDNDGMPDEWELLYPDYLDPNKKQDADDHDDGDTLTNLEEYLVKTTLIGASTDPTKADTDDDGLIYGEGADKESSVLYSYSLDDYEVVNHALGLNPVLADRDSDGMGDAWEYMYGFDPGADDSNSDPDDDHITNYMEWDVFKDVNGVKFDPTASDSDNSRNEPNPDTLADDWEMYYFEDLDEVDSGDFDGDGFTNLREFTLGFNPDNDIDSDEDTLIDEWEMYYWPNDEELTHLPDDDDDHDDLTNKQEHDYFDYIFSPIDKHSLDENPVGDGDVLPDDWEMYYYLDLSETGTNDFDGDKVTDGYEFTYLLTDEYHPSSAQSIDGDTIPDDWEIFIIGDEGTYDDDDDPDGDRVPNLFEYYGKYDDQTADYLNPLDKSTNSIYDDTDSDGVFDDFEVYYGYDPNYITDGNHLNFDYDNDKLTLLDEFIGGEYGSALNPRDSTNSDSDSLPDDWERYYFGNLNQYNWLDADSDGLDNDDEFSYGADPTNPNSDGDCMLYDGWDIKSDGTKGPMNYASSKPQWIKDDCSQITSARYYQLTIFSSPPNDVQGAIENPDGFYIKLRVKTPGTARYQTEYGYMRYGYYSDHPAPHPYDDYVASTVMVRYKTVDEGAGEITDVKVRVYIQDSAGTGWTAYQSMGSWCYSSYHEVIRSFGPGYGNWYISQVEVRIEVVGNYFKTPRYFQLLVDEVDVTYSYTHA
jgi:hypothetical protein